ncbi:hypothetical protein APS67_005725 [Streptomyces sp. AVP053U2]|nr:hypothetical protein APS67_005725 [Streptomyces sp. AVP053U2]
MDKRPKKPEGTRGKPREAEACSRGRSWGLDHSFEAFGFAAPPDGRRVRAAEQPRPATPERGPSRSRSRAVGLGDAALSARCPGLFAVVEGRRGNGDDAGALRESGAEGFAVGFAEGADVGGGEVGAGRPQDAEARLRQARRRQVACGAQVCAELGVVRVRQREGLGDRVRERACGDVRQVLLRRAHRRHRFGGSRHPADLPVREGEGLAGAREGDRAVAHAREGRQEGGSCRRRRVFSRSHLAR